MDRRVRYIMPVYFWTYCYDQGMEHNSSIMTNSLQKNSVAWVLPTASLFFLLVLQKFESIKCCALNPGNPKFYLLVIGMEGGGGVKGSQILLLWIISLCGHNEKNSIMKKIPQFAPDTTVTGVTLKSIMLKFSSMVYPLSFSISIVKRVVL